MIDNVVQQQQQKHRKRRNIFPKAKEKLGLKRTEKRMLYLVFSSLLVGKLTSFYSEPYFTQFSIWLYQACKCKEKT